MHHTKSTTTTGAATTTNTIIASRGSQRSFYAPALLLATAICLSVAISYADAKSVVGVASPQQNTLLSDIETLEARDGDAAAAAAVAAAADAANYDKRVERYAFGLGRRAYTYTNGGNGIKRLPVYNFGLGKRARPYSFGLGKRGEYDEDQYVDDSYNANPYDAAFMDEKRNRPYSFGLGKRAIMQEQPPSHIDRYGFGLGRR